MRLGWLAGSLLLAAASAAPGQDAADPVALVRQGRELLDAGKTDDALAKFAEALKVAPADFEANFWSAIANEKATAKGRAFEFYVKASDAKPDHFIAAFRAGNGYRIRSEWAKAVPYLERAVAALGPAAKGKPEGVDNFEDWFVRDLLGEALIAAGKWKEASKALEEAEKATPDHPNVYFHLAQIEEHGKSFLSAAQLYRKAAATAPPKEKKDRFGNHGVEETYVNGGNRAQLCQMRIALYGEVKGDVFTDGPRNFSVTKPKGDAWWYIYPDNPKNPPLLITIVRPNALGQYDVEVKFLTWALGGKNPAATVLAPSNVTVKFGEPENYLEGWVKNTKLLYADVRDEKPVQKARLGAIPALTASCTAVVKVDKQRYDDEKARNLNPKPPPVYELRFFTMKQKKSLVLVELFSQSDFFKRYEKELAAIWASLKLPP
ncbi:MAG: tetratricopeptide repeat protein [Planctomycetales bacterium]|nr:tetratricopeptide repeat protein [Planctomycetales bacterium]